VAILTINRGLVTSPNELAKPDGAAEILDNCVIDFDNIVQSRRGFSEFGNETDDESVVKQLITYKGRILRHFSDKLSFDSDGNGSFLNFSGSYSELIERLRIKYFELNSNLYFTTSTGIKKISAKSADDFTTDSGFITSAGAVKALGLEGVIVPQASGFLPAQSKVGYKLLWAKKDANGNIIRGVPSSRFVVTNTSKDINVGEEFTIEVTDAGAGIHKQFDSTFSISNGVQTTFLAAAVNITDNTITLTSGSTDHNYQTNDLIKLVQNGSDALPTGLSAGNYYIIRVDTNKVKLKTTTTSTEVDITATGVSGIIESTNVGKTITVQSHGYLDGDKVILYGDLPTELENNKTYYIINKTTDTFELSVSSGGTAIYLTKKTGTSYIYSGINNSHFFTFDTPTNKFGCWFNISGEDTVPTDTSLVGRDLREVEIYKIANKTKENYIAKIAESITNISDVTVLATSTEVTVTNRDGGDVLDVSSTAIDPLLLVTSTVFDGQTSVGTPCNVSLTFIVPSEIISNNDKQYFYEIYRTAPITVATGLTLNDIDPGEEFQKIAEYPVTDNSNPIPTSITYEDIAPETFREGGLFLYTNPVTGEGALQSNEAPPIAHDVAVFKNSAFYANTKEKHRLQFNLLSVSQLISGTSKLYIGNSDVLRAYTFVGQNKIVDFTAKKKSETTGGTYFDIMSAQNKIKYRVWFDLGGSTPPPSDNCILLKVALEQYDSVTATVQNSVDAFIEAFFDIPDFLAQNISHDFNSLTDVNSSTEKITILNHGFENNDTVTFSGTSPTGITNGSTYYIVNKTTNDFQISTSIAGSPLDITAITGTSRIAQSTIRLVYADNGDADDVVESAIDTGWDTPTVFQIGFGEDAANNEVLLSGLASQGLSVEDTARSLERVINKDPLSQVTAFYASGPNDLPGLLILEAKYLIDNPFYLGFSHTTTGNIAIFEPAIPVASIVTDFTSPDVFTTSANHDFSIGQQVYTFIDPTGVVAPIVTGKKIISATPALDTFKLSGFTFGTSFSSFDQAVVFPADVVSDNSVNPNRVYFSKIQQPEAVPLVNYIDIGPRDKAIQRILALRDSLIVLKEDGVYIISGSAAPNFTVRLSDSSALTFAPDTATNLNNLIYVLTSQGVVTVSETGVGVISRNIENKIQEIANAKFNYKLMSWGMSSESDRCYLLWLPEKTTDSYATQAFRYNTFTRTWTRWTKPANCGVVSPADDKIYLGDSSGRPYVLKERKNFERQDLADREIVRGLGANAINGTTYIISSVTELEAGDVLVQQQYLDINKFNRFLKKLDRDSLLSNDYKSLKAFTGDNLADKLVQVALKLQTDGIAVPTPSNSNNVNDLKNDFNAIVSYLNSESASTSFKNYKEAIDLLYYETLVTSVNKNNNLITVKFSNKFIQGDVSFFKGIKCLVQYAPQHFGKPESTKHISEGTIIFDQNNFWGGVVGYSSDRSYDFKSIDFSAKGPGYWDGYNWANTTFGGEGNEVPVRTLIPRDKSRCRYIHVQFIHINAREEWKLIGVSLEPREVSTRGYR
jgi:hypothetical protein